MSLRLRLKPSSMKMPEWLDYQLKLRKLQRDRWKYGEEYDAAIKKARRDGKSRDEIDNLISEAMHETDMVNEELYSLVTRRLRQQTTKLFLPFPDLSDKTLWGEGRLYGRWHLSDKGIATVLAAIRKERKERAEMWAPWLAGVTGLVGALTGLAAIFLGGGD